MKAVFRRAFQDGVAAQRREPRRELVEWAVSDLLSLPGALALHTCGSPHGPLRETLWRLVWTSRQAGQVFARAFGRPGMQGCGEVAAMFLRNAFSRTTGLIKQWVRKAGVCAMRVAKPPKQRPDLPRSIMVAAAGYVGDMVLLHPFLVTLKLNHPEAAITLVTNKIGEELFARDPALYALVVVNGQADRRHNTRHQSERTLRRSLANYSPDIILAPYFYNVSPRPLFDAHDAFVVTFDEEVGFPRRWWYERADQLVTKPRGRSESENLYRMFRHAGLQRRLVRAPLAFEPDEVVEAARDLREQGIGKDSLVIISPGSAKTEKLWREDRWAAIVKYLMRDYELRVALRGTPEEQQMCVRIATASDTSPFVWCDAGLRTQALRLSQARLLISVDNGLRYIAAEMDTPTLALFGPTDERQWRPLAESLKHGVVRGCPWDLTLEERAGLPERYQMDAVSVEQVKRAVEEMLRDDF